MQAEDCQGCISEGVELLGGRLDVLINNAGAVQLAIPFCSQEKDTLNVTSDPFCTSFHCRLKELAHMALPLKM